MACDVQHWKESATGNTHMLLQVVLKWAGLACRWSTGSSRCEAQQETAVSWPPALRALPPELSTAGADEGSVRVPNFSSWAVCTDRHQ